MSGKLYMERCNKCHRPNYDPAVADGICAWCGYVATRDDISSQEDIGSKVGNIWEVDNG